MFWTYLLSLVIMSMARPLPPPPNPETNVLFLYVSPLYCAVYTRRFFRVLQLFRLHVMLLAWLQSCALRAFSPFVVGPADTENKSPSHAARPAAAGGVYYIRI